MASSSLPDAANTFAYTPLANPGSQIRLLTIPLDIKLYLGLTSLGPLIGKLATYDIPVGTMSQARRLLRASRLPLFHAISYVWGDPTKCHEILIDGKRLAITRNLYLALRSMQSGTTGTMHVWADAVCINQEDNAEKSAQIQLMREIYHCASEVRIWLGMGTPETKRCLRFVIDLTDAPSAVYDEPAEREDYETEGVLARIFVPPATAFVRGGIRFGQGFVDFGDIFAPPSARDNETEVIDPDGELSLHQGSIHAISEWRPSDLRLKAAEEREADFIEVARLIDKFFIQQLWFARMWVVQEVCCARSCYVQVGRTALGWEYFVKAVHYLHFHRGAYLDNIRKYVLPFSPFFYSHYVVACSFLSITIFLTKYQNDRARNNTPWLDQRKTANAQRSDPRNPLQRSHRSKGQNLFAVWIDGRPYKRVFETKLLSFCR